MYGKIAPPRPHLIPPPHGWGYSQPLRPPTMLPSMWGRGGATPRGPYHDVTRWRNRQLTYAQQMELFRAIIAQQQRMQRA